MLRRLIAGSCAVAAVTAVATTAAIARDPLHIDPELYFKESGGVGTVAHHHADFCRRHDIPPGGHDRVTWQVIDHEGRSEWRRGTVYCSHVMDVWHNTTGPGSDGISIPCPKTEEPWENSVGFSDGLFVGSSQVHGSFGHNRDGFWHYKFHNWNAQDTARLQMWAVCIDRR